MVATSGDRLLAPAAVELLKRELMPRAMLVTPNLPEAAALLDVPIARSESDMREQAEALLALGAKAVLMKGGHLSGLEAIDLLVTPAASARLSRRTRHDQEHARHRLHALVRDRRRAREGSSPLGSGGGREELRDPRDRRRRRAQRGAGLGTDASLSRLVVGERMTRFTRRNLVRGAGIGLAGVVAAPSVARAQAKRWRIVSN